MFLKSVTFPSFYSIYLIIEKFPGKIQLFAIIILFTKRAIIRQQKMPPLVTHLVENLFVRCSCKFYYYN